MKGAARREAISEAVLSLASREGADRVTLRAVAAEAQVSMGQIQHYFPTRDAMLIAAVQHAMEGMERRIVARARVDDPDGEEPNVAALRSMLIELLGIDQETRRLLRVATAFLGMASAPDEIGELIRADDDELYRFTTDTIRREQVAGRVDGRLDADQEARILWGLAGYLGTEVVFDRLAAADARVTLGYAFDRVFRSRGGT